MKAPFVLEVSVSVRDEN